ncbi:MAG: DUF2341 domain-containing protein, partial [Verrucomicrobiota bacterium]
SSTLRWIGNYVGGQKFSDYLEEFRVSLVERSSNWVWATWLNAASNAQFNCYQPVVTEDPIVDNADGATAITLNAAVLNGNLVSTGAAPTDVSVYWGTRDGGCDPAGWEQTNSFGLQTPGAFSFPATGLTPGRYYYYRFAASNNFGVFWALDTESFITGDITIQATDPTAAETGPDNGAFTVSRPPLLTNENLWVNYTISGNASNGDDYSPLSGRVLIPAGQSNAIIPVWTIDDLVFNEAVETVTVSVASGFYIVGTPATAHVAIADNDFSDDWKNRMKITFCGYDRPSTLIDFPVLVVLNEGIPGFSYNAFASSSGGDLRFLNSNETQQLNFEIESWNPAGDSHVWVQVPALINSNTCIVALWDNDRQSTPPLSQTNGSVFSENYVGVWHMNGKPGGIHLDSSPAGVNGLDQGALDAEGLIAGGQDLEGLRRINITGISSVSSNYTFSYWLKSADAGATRYLTDIQTGRLIPTWNRNGTGRLGFFDGAWRDGTALVTINDFQWHHIVFTFEASSGLGRTYLDGQFVESLPYTPRRLGGLARIGSDFNGNGAYYDGLMDEHRISEVVRSPDWIWASWSSTAPSNSFACYTVTPR